MDNKVKFLRGTATEYEASTKDNDTFYYTTDDEKLYLGNKEITGGGVTIDDTLSDTSKNPVQNKVINAALNNKAELTDIPTTLPANGGMADAARETVSPNAKAKLWEDPEGGNLKLVSPDGNHSVEMDLYNNEGFRMYFTDNGELTFPVDYNSTTKKFNINGNADTVDGKHASDFALKTDIPTSLPANGGNAATVNGHSVNSDVPAGAKFTDTTYAVATTTANGLMSSTDKSKLDGIATGANKYTHPSYTARTGVPTGNQTPAFGGTFQVTQPVSDASGHITAMNSRTITIPATAASASAAGLVTTAAQTFAGNKTFNGQVIPAGASAVGTAQARKIYAGTSDMTAGTTALETGAIYLVYE